METRVEAELELGLVWSRYQHTEEHGNEGGGGQKLVQHPEVDGLDLVLQLPVLVVNEPLQHRLFRLQVPVEGERLAVAEIHEGGEGLDAVARNDQNLTIRTQERGKTTNRLASGGSFSFTI